MPSRNKRLVFVHPDGLHQILGHSGSLGEHPIPVVLPAFETRGRVVEFSSLYKMTTQAAYFREPMTPASYSFDARQK